MGALATSSGQGPRRPGGGPGEGHRPLAERLLPEAGRPPASGQGPCSCLIVDDSAWFLRAARALLEREGLSVAVATSAAEGLRLAQLLHPDIVLVDIVLGDDDGFGLARRLASEVPSGPAIVLVSTHAEAEFADLIDRSPADAFLPKAELSADALCRIYARRGPKEPSEER